MSPLTRGRNSANGRAISGSTVRMAAPMAGPSSERRPPRMMAVSVATMKAKPNCVGCTL